MTGQQQDVTHQLVLAVQDIASITHQGASAFIQINDSIDQISQQTSEPSIILGRAQPVAA